MMRIKDHEHCIKIVDTEHVFCMYIVNIEHQIGRHFYTYLRFGRVD